MHKDRLPDHPEIDDMVFGAFDKLDNIPEHTLFVGESPITP